MNKHWRIQRGPQDVRPRLGSISFIFMQFLANPGSATNQ